MFDAVPIRIWLLLLIGAIAWAPARYVAQRFAWLPFVRKTTEFPQDPSWRPSGALVANVGILVALAALAIFIFTPAAEEFGRSPSLMPVLGIAFGCFALWSVYKSLQTGSVAPLVRGPSWQFDRGEHPKRFWLSLGWNGLLGGAMLVFGAQLLIDAPLQSLRDRCNDWTSDSALGEVVSACDRLLADGDNDDRPGAYLSRGSAHYRAGEYRQAGADYTAALRLDPKNGPAHYNLGLVHEQFDDRRGAIIEYSAALAIDPRNVEAFQNRGIIYLDAGRFDEAIADFTDAAKLQPNDVMTIANRGVAYAWKRDRMRAERDFAVVRKSDPSSQILLHGEALLAMASGDTSNEIRFLSAAIARNPDDRWALSRRAMAYQRLGDSEKMRADMAAAQKVT